MRNFLTCGFCLGLALLANAGCGSSGPALIPVKGVVTYEGRPLAGAKVAFIPEGKGAIAMGSTDATGLYEIKTGAEPGVIAGVSTVTVVMMEAGGTGGLPETMTPEQMQDMAIAGTLDKAMEKQNQSLIPEHYGTAKTSGLSKDVKSGENNEYNIELK